MRERRPLVLRALRDKETLRSLILTARDREDPSDEPAKGQQADREPLDAQIEYLHGYLSDLEVTTALEEPYYFDRDYLSEFAAFYGASARGYPNVCRRLHFFRGPELDRSALEAAMSMTGPALAELQERYCGFIVIRPIPGAPLGRTVLAHYKDRAPRTPRITTPARTYSVHIAGLRLEIKGLAWQQQDAAVSACATIALWTMLHSSAYDEHHAVPTTTAVTLSAHRTASMGARIFPSSGLKPHQIAEAIKEHGLTPLVLEASDSYRLRGSDGYEHSIKYFSRRELAHTCATLIRSGYPVVIAAQRLRMDGERWSLSNHAVCAVGFRSCAPGMVLPGRAEQEDENIPFLYLHDDNTGPNVRCRVYDDDPRFRGVAALLRAPPQAGERPSGVAPRPQEYTPLIPYVLIAGVHNDLRLGLGQLNNVGEHISRRISARIADIAKRNDVMVPGLSFGVRFLRQKDYLGEDLDRLLADPALRGRVRLALVEQVPPMSLHLGVVRIGRTVSDSEGVRSLPLMDILFDTTDSQLNAFAFAHLMFDPGAEAVIAPIRRKRPTDFGKPIAAHP